MGKGVLFILFQHPRIQVGRESDSGKKLAVQFKGDKYQMQYQRVRMVCISPNSLAVDGHRSTRFLIRITRLKV